MISHHEEANHAPLTPVSFLLRAAKFFADRTAVVYGDQFLTYGEFYGRVRRLADALKHAGVGVGDTVGLVLPNIPPMLEAHYAVPMIGAVLNPQNFGLDAASIGYQLEHAAVRLLICDREYLAVARHAIDYVGHDLQIVVVNDPEAGLPSEPGMIDYEKFIADATTTDADLPLEDENKPLSLLYTSGTTMPPKGVIYSHRGAYLAALSNALSFGLNQNTVFLWTWPMFHSNGLSFVWAVTAVAGIHICVRSVDVGKLIQLIRQHRANQFCVAPSIINQLASDPRSANTVFDHPVSCTIGGAAPSSSIIRKIEKMGIDIAHQYGSTESYGPATIAWRRPEWDQMTIEERYVFMGRQGTPTPAIADLKVADLVSTQTVAQDGETLGEVMLRGNTIMVGYFGNDDATRDAMLGGWFRTGDIAVWHPDGAIEIKDRSVDLIISASERISSVEIEEVLNGHPDVFESSVVARRDNIMGEVPCAFVVPVAGADLSADALNLYCGERLAAFKLPKKYILLAELPKTKTGKIKKNGLRDLANTQ